MKKSAKEIKAAFDALSLEEQAKWEKIAKEINDSGFGAYMSLVGNLLKEGILINESNELCINGKYAAKMYQEQGIPFKIWTETIMDKLKKTKPNNTK